MDYTLSMVFITESGLKTSLSISGVKPDITKDQVDSLMNTIIEKDVFVTKSGKLATKESAHLVARNTTKFDVK